MNHRGYFALFSGLATTAPLLVYASVATPDAPVPWQSTFSGMNAPTVKAAPLSAAGPFQASSSSPSLPTFTPSANPFQTSANDISQQATKSAAQSIASILTDIYTPLPQKINAMFTNDTTMGGAPMKMGPQTKTRIPPAASAVSNMNNVSFTQLQRTIQTPPAPLFPDNQALAQAYQNFMHALQGTPSFFPLFRKLHIVALHQIYLYLVGIYTALNMTHIDDLKTYMITEKQYALNKKTLIINHLVKVVMAQLGQAIRALMPNMPESSAISAGIRCLQHDSTSDPNILVMDLEKSVLAVLGLEKLDSSLTSLAYLGIKQYMPIVGIPESGDLSAALTLLTSANFSVKSLTKAQASALSLTIYKILSYLTQQATGAHIDALISYLNSPDTANPSSDQIAQLTSLVTGFSVSEPLSKQIAFAKKMAQLLGNDSGTPSNAPLSSEELSELKGIIAYILEQYEKISVSQVTGLIQTLGQLNPTYEVLSPSQALAVKDIALRMLGKYPYTKPLRLENLTETQRSDLAYALWVASNNATTTTFTSDQMQTLQSIALPLKEHAMSQQNLSSGQSAVLQQALTVFSTYSLSPLTEQDFGTQVQNSLAAANPSQSEDARQKDIEQAMSTIESPNFTSFNQLTSEEQILLLQLLQSVDQVFETRLQAHRAEASVVHLLLSQNAGATSALCASITAGQYETLNTIDAFIESATGPVSCAALASIKQPDAIKSWMAPTQALLRLFTTQKPSSDGQNTATSTPAKNQRSAATGNSYLAILLSLQNTQESDKTLAQFASTLPPQEVASFQKILPLVSQPNFSFTQIDAPTRSALASALTSYKNVLAKAPAKKYTINPDLSDPTQNALQTVSAVVSSHNNLQAMRTSFLSVLKEYLVFFNLYAQALQDTSSNPNTPAYVGLTRFAEHADQIRKALKYESSSNDSVAKLVQQANPPLFFYDPDTFRSIRLLPKLAAEVENSSVAPFPTFGIEQASSGDGTAHDPLTGQTVTNLQSIGSFSFQKFFFLQAPHSTNEMTGSLPTWVKKVEVKSSKGTTYLYEPNNIPNDGITGFYMNIPVFGKDPYGAMTIRLYEQPIIAQPTWLNKSGTTAKATQTGITPHDQAGVITLLRGCLGDFQSLLDLNIFDPCLSIIFASALALSDNNAVSNAAQTFTQEKVDQCTTYIQEKTAMLNQQESPLPPSPASQAVGTTVQSSGGSS